VLVVTNAYPTETDPSSGVFIAAQIESLRAQGLLVTILHVKREAEGRSAYRGLASRLAEAIEMEQPDLVHVMYGGVMANVITRAASTPTVVSFCGSDLNGAPMGSLTERVSAWYGVRASHKAARRADGIVVKSRGLAGALPADIDQNIVSVVPNGVDLKLFRPQDQSACRSRLGWEPDGHHVVFYARGPGKRPELAQEAVARAAGAGLPVCLHVMAGIRQEEVPVWMNAADALICTSVREGSPNTVKEALACNLPVISVDVGDIRERITGVEGCYVVSPDVAEIAGAIAEVCRTGGRVDGVTAVRELSLERVAERILEVYALAMERVEG